MWTLGCETGSIGFSKAHHDRPLSHTSPRTNRMNEPESPLERDSREVAFHLEVAERRLKKVLPRPTSLKQQACPDEALRTESRRPLLHLLYRDSRADRRQLLPLSVTRQLSVDELRAVRDRFVQPSDQLAAPVYHRLRDLDGAEAAKQELRDLAARPYAAVAHVINYSEPRLTRKPNALRRHWVPGVLDTLLVVHDLEQEQPLCQVRVTVRNDVADAPIRIRLRSDTRERLKHQLGELWRQQAAKQLGQISSYLQWPANQSDAVRGGS